MEMLMFHIDKKRNQPIYIQLYDNIKESIIEGTLREGEKLPSKRHLSQYLSVSQTTIEHAYLQLIDEEFIVSKPKSGYYVSDIESLPFIARPSKTPVTFQAPSQNAISYQYRFQLGAIDQAHFPFAILRKFAKEAFEDLQHHLVETGHKQGEYALRKEISHYLFHSRGVQATPEQVIVASSTDQILSIITDLLSPKSHYLLEDPLYPQVHQLLKRKHIHYSFLQVHHDGLHVDDHHGEKDVVYITPSHQFPTGVTMKLKSRIALLKWAHATPTRYIIEDDYDSEFRYEGKPIPALQSLDQSGSVIYVSTFSKSIAPSIRIAYAVLPETLQKQYQQTQNIEGGSVPRHTQYMVSQFMASHHFERHLNRMRKIYRQKRDKLITILREYPEHIEISGEMTGMHFVITIKNGWTEDQCLKQFQRHRIDLKPLSAYCYHSTPHTPQFVLGFGGIPMEEVEAHATQLLKSLEIEDTSN
ncbi:PLP-dependent aminotransferase family protein [Staphylococcus agnetis]|uniref:MocR-like pyridoxine biosynthesis transcription factor PdxR n=1 Tax=Staphylococcus agnetis TaxID=985762 RepID=UPI000D1B392F|nr:PLP-dependent aminotransferase family protein [Staphylococcus agnetis]PTH32841.1 PLP-dependent aminotransferase family protein [Staphylococcus agnetis]PTH70874.1 PLP-dependent aminotransferase family protein [Staphylococcus agnetis]PTH77387.1 PLP-dependent aminotransferase family protein [Staphylococcus agnetis]